MHIEMTEGTLAQDSVYTEVCLCLVNFERIETLLPFLSVVISHHTENLALQVYI